MIPLRLSPSRISLDRAHSLSGKNTLDWFFANRKWIRTAGNSIVEAAWAKRPLPEGEQAIRFLLLAAKKSHKRAHDRNKVRRWLRAAIVEAEEFAELESQLAPRSEQVLVMLRISQPVSGLKWDVILSDVKKISAHLRTRSMPKQSLQ